MNDNGREAEDADDQSNPAARTLALIGQRIRELRRSHDLTLQQLAHCSGISASMLSLVERGRASPSIGSLVLIADALESSIAELMTTEDVSDNIVVRRDAVKVVETPERVTRRVMKEDRANGISIAVHEYAPGTASHPTPISHEGFEYGLLLEGTLTVDVEGSSHVLMAGDLVAYSSHRPHRIWNHGETPARIVWVNTARR